jgi:hypothetical protein
MDFYDCLVLLLFVLALYLISTCLLIRTSIMTYMNIIARGAKTGNIVCSQHMNLLNFMIIIISILLVLALRQLCLAKVIVIVECTHWVIGWHHHKIKPCIRLIILYLPNCVVNKSRLYLSLFSWDSLSSYTFFLQLLQPRLPDLAVFIK